MQANKVGTYAWLLESNGKLSFQEKIQLMNKLLIPSLVNPIKEYIYKNQYIDSKITLDQFVIPDTTMIKVAIEELESKASSILINHSWRTYFWGAILGQLKDITYDPETLLTACLFHDIGLTDAHQTPKSCKCFTQKSAEQFELKAREIDWNENKIELIKDAICLHMNGFSDNSYSEEATLLQQGASCDVIGEQLHKIPKQIKQQILEQYPRNEFNKTFIELIRLESKSNPHSRTAFLAKLGLPMMIHLNPYKS